MLALPLIILLSDGYIFINSNLDSPEDIPWDNYVGLFPYTVRDCLANIVSSTVPYDDWVPPSDDVDHHAGQSTEEGLTAETVKYTSIKSTWT